LAVTTRRAAAVERCSNAVHVAAQSALDVDVITASCGDELFMTRPRRR